MPKMDRTTTLGEMVDSIEDSPWIYCNGTLIASPVDDLYTGSYTEYIQNLGLSEMYVDTYGETHNPIGERILNINLDPAMDEYLMPSEKIVDIAKDLIIKNDLTRQQGLVIALVDYAKLPKKAAAGILHVQPQIVSTVYKVAKNKMKPKEE